MISVRDLRDELRRFRAVRGISFEVVPARSSPSSGPNGPARRRRSRSSRAIGSARGGGVGARRRPGLPHGRGGRGSGSCCRSRKLEPSLTVAETLRAVRRASTRAAAGRPGPQLVGLAEARRRIGRLSGGQQRRVDVGLGIIGDPDLSSSMSRPPGSTLGASDALADDRGPSRPRQDHLLDHPLHGRSPAAGRSGGILRRGKLAAVGTTADIGADLGAETRIASGSRPGSIRPRSSGCSMRRIEFEGVSRRSGRRARRMRCCPSRARPSGGASCSKSCRRSGRRWRKCPQLTAESDPADGDKPQEALR